MSRRLLVFALLALVLVAAVTGRSGAAFVDAADTAAPASADHVKRWLGLTAPGAGSCTSPASSQASGEDEAAAVAVGGAETVSPAGRTASCVLVLTARSPLPEGAERITVRVAPTAGAGEPVTAAALTALDGSGAASSATLAAGERRALRLTVRDASVVRSTLPVVVDVGAETTGFLRYGLPVDVCAAALAATCVAPDPDPDPDPVPSPGLPGQTPGGTPPVQGSAGSANQATPKKPSARTCTSRRRFQIRLRRLPRGVRYVSSRVTVDGKRVKARRVKRGGRWLAIVDLRGKTKTQVRVVVISRTSAGRTVREIRRYRTCTPKQKKASAKKKATVKR